MASTGQKEYVIRFNGVDKAIKDFTKLEDVVNSLDDAIKEVTSTEIKSTAASKQKKAALTEEEKAVKKLADTQKKIAAVNSEANKAQIAANLQLRERTREVTRQIAAEKLAEGSIKAMGMQLTDLRNQYEELTAAERAEEEVGGALLTQIQALDAEYKALRESTGNFRDSVGNYEKAFSGLNQLKDKFELASRGSAEMASNIIGTNDVLDAFGNTTTTVAKSAEQLAGITGLATLAQQAYNAVVKEGWIQNKAAAIMDGVRAVQLKAKTAAEALSTKGTIAATIAQRIFNIVANANPYVLLATAIITVVGALAFFISRTSSAAEKQKTLNDLQSIYLDGLEREGLKLREQGNARVKALENQLAILNASGAKTKDIRAVEDKLALERGINNAKQRGYFAFELAALDANKKKIDDLYVVLTKLKDAQTRGDSKIKIDIDLDGKIEKVKIDDAIESVQGTIDNLDRSVKFAVDLKVEQDEIAQQIKEQNAARAKEDRDAAKERAEKAAEAAKQRAELELNAVRAGEDARIALIEDENERQRQTINKQYDRQIEDLKKQLATEKNLTATARKSINDNIVASDLQRNKDLIALSKEIKEKELQNARAAEDARIALIQGGNERAKAEIDARYSREIQDLDKKLKTEKSLTLKQQEELTDLIVSLQMQRSHALETLAAEGAQHRVDLELAAVDFAYEKANNAIGELQKRNKDGLKFIDVKGTKANLKESNDALANYITGLKKYQDDLKAAHEVTLSTLKKDTPEYEEEVQRFSSAYENAGFRIKEALKKIEENTRESTKVQINYFREMFDAIAEYAQVGADIAGNFFSVWNQGLQAQVDDMNEQLDLLNERYEDAQKQREDAVTNVENIEAQLQNATGGTADALKSQLADAMHARNEAARQEQQLAKEKEKREADIRKKEKQMKRNELISNIGMAIANTAQSVTKALAMGFPLGLVLAVLYGAMGALQVGIMTRQLTKLADGGPIIGPSHGDGGVPIGLGYEAEGGEFVTNKDSYKSNAKLVEFINASSGTITAADLAGIIPGDTSAPVIINNAGTEGEDRIVQAIEAIKLNPVVSVTDINNVQDEIATVEDLAGF